MALTTNTMRGDYGITQGSTGTLVTDAAAAAAATVSLGFTPRYIRISNLTDRITYEWFEGMTNPGALKQAAAGTGTLETTEGPTVNAPAVDGTGNSFTIPATIMLASKTFAWAAFG